MESFVDGFHIMPISIMYLGLCPGGGAWRRPSLDMAWHGIGPQHPPTIKPNQISPTPTAEGTALAALQTFVSLAVMTSNNIGLLFLRIWDVSADTIASRTCLSLYDVHMHIMIPTQPQRRNKPNAATKQTQTPKHRQLRGRVEDHAPLRVAAARRHLLRPAHAALRQAPGTVLALLPHAFLGVGGGRLASVVRPNPPTHMLAPQTTDLTGRLNPPPSIYQRPTHQKTNRRRSSPSTATFTGAASPSSPSRWWLSSSQLALMCRTWSRASERRCSRCWAFDWGVDWGRERAGGVYILTFDFYYFSMR